MTPGKSHGVPRAVALAVLVASVAVTTSARAGADSTTPGGSTTTLTTAPSLGSMSSDQLAQAVQLAVELTAVTSQLAKIDQQLPSLQTSLAAAQNDFEVLDTRYTNDQSGLTGAVARLRGRAAVTYENSTNLIGATLEIQHVESLEVGQQYVDAADVADTRAVTQLAADLAAVKGERDQRANTVRALQGQVTWLNTDHDELTARAAADQSALEGLGGVPVLGTARLTAQQLADWFRSAGQHAHLSGTTTIDDLTRLYIDEGQAAGVRGDVAFAQAIIETGSFGHATDNNFAGIGACDSCVGEPSFPTPQAGVRAQIQLLRSYADPASTADNLGNPPDPTLFGADPVTAASTFDNFSYKGKVPLWNEMGNGKWATDPNYSSKVLRTYLQILTFADQATDPSTP